MMPIEQTVQVGSDGVLRLALALGADAAGRQVRILIEPVQARPDSMTLEEWQRFRSAADFEATDAAQVRRHEY